MTPLPTVDVLLHGFPFGCDHGHIAFCEVVLVEGPDASGRMTRIVYDLGHAGRRELIWAALESRGLTPADVDLVVLSHAHWDHIQNLDVFEHAPVLIHPDERRYLLDPHPRDHATPRWTSAIIERQQVQEVGEGSTLIPGVEVVELPGHSPCCIGLLVDTAEGGVLLASDAIQTAGVARAGRNPIVFWDADQADRSVRRARDLADVIYPGHDQPFRHVRGQDVEYLAPFAVTFVDLPPEGRGVGYDASPAGFRFVMEGAGSLRLPQPAPPVR